MSLLRVEFSLLFKLAYRNLFRNRRRSLFAIVIAAAGCTALCVAVGYYRFSIYSLQELTIRNGFGGSCGFGHVQVMDQRIGEGQSATPLEYGLDSVAALQKSILSDADVDYVLPRMEVGGLITKGNITLPFKGFGVDAAKEAMLWGGMSRINPRLKLGEQLLPLKGKKGVLLGKGIAQSLHASKGDMVMLYSTTAEGAINALDAEVLGILSTGVSETDRYYMLTNLDFVQSLLHTTRISLMAVMFKNRDDIDAKVEKLTLQLGKNNAMAHLKIVEWEKDAAFYVSIRDIFNIIFSFMIVIVMALVLLSCWNIMNMTTMERIREIGTFRAIGIPLKTISLVFYLEALMIGVAGIVIGWTLHLVIAEVLNMLHIQMPPVPGMNRPYTLQVYAATWLHPIILAGIVLVMLLSSTSAFVVIRRFSIVSSLDHN
jgi:putative ABC transport system permease protein